MGRRRRRPDLCSQMHSHLTSVVSWAFRLPLINRSKRLKTPPTDSARFEGLYSYGYIDQMKVIKGGSDVGRYNESLLISAPAMKPGTDQLNNDFNSRVITFIFLVLLILITLPCNRSWSPLTFTHFTISMVSFVTTTTI